MACNFISVLSKLRKLSMESVENTASFDDFKKYLHVLRPVEEELRSLLNRINTVNKKTLVLLCGSAGDGKSHLLSYLRNADSAHLLDGFELYNDATESSAPQLTSIDKRAQKYILDEMHPMYNREDAAIIAKKYNLEMYS